MFTFSTTRALLAGASLLCLPGSAFALDGEDFLGKLSAALQAGGFSIAYDAVSVDGTDLTVKGLSLTGPHASPAETPLKVGVGDMTVTDVREDGQGGYTAGKATFPALKVPLGDFVVTLDAWSVSGLTLPADPSGISASTTMLYDRAEAGTLRLFMKDREVYSIDSVSGSLFRVEDSLSFTTDASGFKADIADLAGGLDPVAASLGLDVLKGGFTMNSTWYPTDGSLMLDEFRLDLDKIGVVGASFEIGGYTSQVAAEMRALQGELAQGASTKEQQEAFREAFGNLTVTSASVYFQDHGIVKPLLELAGKQHGMSGDEMAKSLEAMVPFALATIQPAALRDSYAAAARDFLAQPDAIRISAEPEKPLMLMEIMLLGGFEAHSLPAALGVSVAVND
jgi:hypothetical protein